MISDPKLYNFFRSKNIQEIKPYTFFCTFVLPQFIIDVSAALYLKQDPVSGKSLQVLGSVMTGSLTSLTTALLMGGLNLPFENSFT